MSLLPTAAALLFAAVPAAPDCPDCGLRELRLESRALGEPRLVRIRLPEGYARGAGRYPVVYVLDGDDHLDHTAATAAFLARQGAMPPCIVVAVRNVDRARDFTPTRAAAAGAYPTAGGAARFLAFLSGELVPAVDQGFRTAPFRILSGHSLGGLLALHALATAPETFQAYLAASPSAAWDDGLVVKELAARLRAPGRLDRSLFVSLGDEAGMVPGWEALLAVLGSARTPGFRWDAARWPGDPHGLVPLATTMQGLRFVFDGFLPPRDPATGRIRATPGELEAHYRALSLRLGLEVPPPDAAMDELAEELEAAGRVADAVAAYERAVELAEASGSPLLPEFRRHLRAAQRKVSAPGASPGLGR